MTKLRDLIEDAKVNKWSVSEINKELFYMNIIQAHDDCMVVDARLKDEWGNSTRGELVVPYGANVKYQISKPESTSESKKTSLNYEN